MTDELFRNSHGEFPEGTRVFFEMENADVWAGDTIGVLARRDGKWGIDTEHSGFVPIGGYLEAYHNTVRPALNPPHPPSA